MIADDFLSLFAPRPGFQLINVPVFVKRADGKLECPEQLKGSAYATHKEKPDAAALNSHLNGRLALALRGQRVGVLDIDPDNYNTFDAVQWIDDNAVRIRRADLIATVSKSGGVRLWRFMAEIVTPSLIRADLEFWIESFDTRGTSVEVWPDGKKFIQLPFFNNEDETGKTLETFVDLAQSLRKRESDLRYNGDSKTKFGNSRNAPREGITIDNDTGERVSRFSDLVDAAPMVEVVGSLHRYSFKLDDEHEIKIDGIANLSNVQRVKEAIATQAKVFIAGLTKTRWETELERLFEDVTPDTYGDSTEALILEVIDNQVRQSMTRGGGIVVTDPDILFLGDLRVWIEEKTRLLWFRSSLMLNAIKGTGLVPGGVSPQKLADIARSIGGTVPKNGKHVPRHGSVRLVGIPVSDEIYDAALDSKETQKPIPDGVLGGAIFSTRFRRLELVVDPEAQEKQTAFMEKEIRDSIPY